MLRYPLPYRSLAAVFLCAASCSFDFDKSDTDARNRDAAAQPSDAGTARDGASPREDAAGTDGAGCSPREDVCGNQVDDDCDGKIDEGVPEACNGIDDDCDGVIDVAAVQGAPQCASDDSVSCTTTCGSRGTGQCTAACQFPSGPACSPPAENLCNQADEDCDGVVDENLTNRNAVDSIWLYPAGTYNNTQVAMTPRAAGGFHLFYRPWNNPTASARAISAYQLIGGDPLEAASVASKTTDVSMFVADGDGQHTVLLERIVVNTDKKALRLQLFGADDLSFVSEFVPTETKMALAKDDVVPLDVAVARSENGDLHVLLVYYTYSDTGPVSKTKFRVLHRSAGGLWSANPEVTIADTSLNALNVQAERVPCREEFLISYAYSTVHETRRVLATSGVYGGGDLYSFAPATVFIVGLASAPADCRAGGSSEMLVAFEASSSTYLQHLAIAPDGTVSALGESVDLGARVFSVSAVKNGGRWFVAGTPNGGGPALWEHSLDATGGSTLRSIPLLNVSDPKNADPGALGGYPSIFPSRCSVIFSEGNLYALFPNGDFAPGNKLVAAYTAQTGTAPANTPSAVMYRVGCP